MIPEPFNSIALLVVGALFGGIAWGWWCGCLPRLRWRRRWHKLCERQGREFYDMPSGDTARFIAQQVQARNEQRARDLARRAGEVKP